MDAIPTDVQVFMQAHGISPSEVFDASGMGKTEREATMKRLGRLFCFGTPRCKSGHDFRTRAGHCAMCDHAKIAYMRRHDAPGVVYVAASVQGGALTKVGTAEFAYFRAGQLNIYAYGGRTDWRIVHKVEAQRAGRVEAEAHRLLRASKAQGTYFKDGAERTCYELFDCSFEDAIKAVNAAMLLHG